MFTQVATQADAEVVPVVVRSRADTTVRECSSGIATMDAVDYD